MASTTEDFVRTPIRPPLSSSTSATVSSASSITCARSMGISKTYPYTGILTWRSMQLLVLDRHLTIPLCFITASVQGHVAVGKPNEADDSPLGLPRGRSPA